ncbi:unnamed protein product [Rhizopus stolonifer]
MHTENHKTQYMNEPEDYVFDMEMEEDWVDVSDMIESEHNDNELQEPHWEYGGGQQLIDQINAMIQENLKKKSKRTKRVGITGECGTHYGASLRETKRRWKSLNTPKYTCTFCGKDTVKCTTIGIWKCKGCKKTLIGGGAYTVSTAASVTILSTVHRLHELAEI